MATLTVTPTQTFISGDTVLPATLNQLAQSTVALTAGTIVAADIASDAVTTAKINNAAVTAAKLDGAQTGSAPIYGCRAWVRFDATRDASGSVSAANTNRRIIASGNVSSVLRSAAGAYTVTFATAMPSSDYSAVVSTRHAEGNSYASNADSHTLTASTVVINTGWQHPTNGGTPFDPTSVNLSVFA